MSENMANATQLQEVPLATGQQNNTTSPSQTLTRKGTIRRFFKLPNKKSVTCPDTQSEGDAQNSDSKETAEPRRFHLRMGSKPRSQDPDSDELPSTSAQNITHKLAPKKSIFKYWQTIFKNVKGARSSTSFTPEQSIDASANVNEEPVEDVDEADGNTTADNDTTAEEVSDVQPEVSAQEENKLDDDEPKDAKTEDVNQPMKSNDTDSIEAVNLTF